MTNEYITKAQAIALAESLRPIAGNGITDAFIKGIEGVEGYRGIATNVTFEGEKVIALEGLTKHWPSEPLSTNRSVCVPRHGVWYRTPNE